MKIEKSFIADIKKILSQARQRAFAVANSTMLIAYWKVGKRIIDEEQKGKQRAQYGSFLIKELSLRLTEELGKGFDERELRRMRQFYLYFENWGSVRPELTWTHYRYLLRIEEPQTRHYYMIEAVQQSWTTRHLERNINSQYYHRLLSTQKSSNSRKKHPGSAYDASDLVKDPYVLEFLGIEKAHTYSESGLETALIDKLQHFLLELGKGYAFVARQYYLRTETKEFYIDLVFYNFLLKCFVLIDLKITELTHQDIGQMDMYVRLFEDLKKLPGDNPTLGIILCSDKDETIVKYSMLNGSDQLFASKYKLYLPHENELIQEIESERIKFQSR